MHHYTLPVSDKTAHLGAEAGRCSPPDRPLVKGQAAGFEIVAAETANYVVQISFSCLCTAQHPPILLLRKGGFRGACLFQGGFSLALARRQGETMKLVWLIARCNKYGVTLKLFPRLFRFCEYSLSRSPRLPRAYSPQRLVCERL